MKKKRENYSYLKEPKEIRKFVRKAFVKEIAIFYGILGFCWFFLALKLSSDNGIRLLPFCQLIMPSMIAPIGLCILMAIYWWFYRKSFFIKQAHEKVFESKKKTESNSTS